MNPPTEPASRSRNAHVFFETIDALPERIRNIATLRGLGYSFREIGAQFNVTPQAISLMLARHRSALKKIGGSTEMAQLSARAVNALGRRGIRSREEARSQNVLALLERERNCGRKTINEISAWMAAPTPVSSPSLT